MGRTGPLASALVQAVRKNGRVGWLGWLVGQARFRPTAKEDRKRFFIYLNLFGN
jgi:type IV secretory pathway TrbD component